VFPDCMGDGTAPMKPGAGLAQLVEHLICNQGVASSNLAAGTITNCFNCVYSFQSLRKKRRT
jgi:hypothetical protein